MGLTFNEANRAINKIITITDGALNLQVCPAAGGSITRFWSGENSDSIEWMRAATAADIQNRNPLGMASFPLLPYSGRIREGRFVFDGRCITQALNFLPERHAIHGHGWQNEWSVLEQTANRLTIEYRHNADSWPWSYRAQQIFSLSEGQLTIETVLINESDQTMPAGIGMHPYFPRTPTSRVQAKAKQVWKTDDEVMPVELDDLANDHPLLQGFAASTLAMDNAYAGWNGTALLEWPEHRAGMTIHADSLFSHLVVYSPPNENYFCVEPVSHCTDAFNMAKRGRTDTGMIVLEPSEKINATTTFKPKRQLEQNIVSNA